jgi:hypothetical protein
MKYTLIIFALLFASHFSFAQTEPLEGKENAVELDKEIEGQKKVTIRTQSITASNQPLFIIEGIVVDKKMLDTVSSSSLFLQRKIYPTYFLCDCHI